MFLLFLGIEDYKQTECQETSADVKWVKRCIFFNKSLTNSIKIICTNRLQKKSKNLSKIKRHIRGVCISPDRYPKVFALLIVNEFRLLADWYCEIWNLLENARTCAIFWL